MTAIRRVVGLLTAVALMVCASPAWAADGFSPAAVNVTLGPGESTHVSKTLHLDALPGKADIVIAIDTTGSMCDAIAQAKADATNIVNQVQTAIPGARFALIDFKDYSDYPPNGYHLVVPLTPSAAVFQAGMDTLICGGGADAPEAYAAVYHASTSDPLLTATYDPGASRFLVVLGDAAPHDANLHASFPACDDTPPTDPVGPTIDQLNAMNGAGIKLLMIHYTHPGTSTSLACMQQQAAVTGGNAVEQGGDLASQIIASITAASSHINRVDLVVDTGCQLTISFDPPPPYGPFTAPVDIGFTETITAPTIPGSYDCTVTANVDGTARAIETVHATVTAGSAAIVTVTPATATNPAGKEHCVTAHVADAFGNPVAGTTVTFAVSAGPNAGATFTPPSAVTNASGDATACYTGTHVGTDTITATAAGTTVSGTATKTYTPGAATKVTLTPATATNPTGAEHCVTAHVTDAFGNPVDGVTVFFSVTGANPTSGAATTNASGDAQFCYTGSMVGADVITAIADANANGTADAGEPTGGATKAWVAPASSCGEVEAEGYILTALGKGLFAVNVDSDAGASSPSGHVAYADTGAKKVLVSVQIDSTVIVDSSHAQIFGMGKVNGGAAQPFRVDLGHAAAGDTFSIQWAGYAAAGNVVRGTVKIESEPCTPEHENDGDDDDHGGQGGDDHGNGGGGDNSHNHKKSNDKGHGGAND